MAEKPPSTDNSTPFTKLESSEARNSATVAISSGRPIFPRGIRDSNIRFASSVRTWSCIVEQRQRLLNRKQRSGRIQTEGRIEVLLGNLAQRDGFARACARE